MIGAPIATPQDVEWFPVGRICWYFKKKNSLFAKNKRLGNTKKQLLNKNIVH